MAEITFQGTKVHTNGELPVEGDMAPEFILAGADLSDVSLESFRGSKLVLNIFPSIDTEVCKASVRQFNSKANNFSNTKILCISADLPFAQARFCGSEGLENVITLSDFRDGKFGEDYGVALTDSPLRSLLARAVVVIDENGVVAYSQLVPDIGSEPDYETVFNRLNVLSVL